MDYEKLLKRAVKSIPKNVFEHSRFTIPSVIIYQEGKSTIVTNFKEISDRLRRKPEYINMYFAAQFECLTKVLIWLLGV